MHEDLILTDIRGPEIESWFGVEDGVDPAVDNDWGFLPFMALSDGAHASTEDFSYFTLRRRSSANSTATSAFGISCTRQMDASELLVRPADVTRSTVQKAVVVIAQSPQSFSHLREKLSMVTGAWFAQRDFTDVDILKSFQDSLVANTQAIADERDSYLGLSLRELIYEYKYQTLVLFKCCLLQPKMLFFGSRCERLCLMQFSLISLIPGLLRCLQDCADPEFDSYRKNFVPPASLRTSERTSLLSYMGLPLQIFGQGSLFGPYTPLQQLDLLADHGTRSYIVGSTNSLLLQQKDRYSDILINLDESTISITSPSLRSALALSAADRRWIDFLTQTVTSTWDPMNPSRPTTLAYMGSEEFIRLQFEEYLLALLASVKYHLYRTSNGNLPQTHNHHHHPSNDPDPVADFNLDWLSAWQTTPSYALFHTTTDPHLFDIVEPRHPTAGNLSIEDVQRRVAQQIQALHLDDRFASTKENLNKHFATGQKKVSTALGNLWNDIEAFREAQRAKAAAEQLRVMAVSAGDTKGSGTDLSRAPSSASSHFSPSSPSSTVSTEKTTPMPSPNRFSTARAPDLATAQASVAAAGQKAGAYMSSWGTWASEKRKGWAVGGRGASGWIKRPGAGEADPVSPEGQRSPGKKKSREEKGGDGIGRLDA
ncbi:MAG: hypothetical protein Q9219_005055 [cf. Caloplaca sp. 3 TL-2023]